MAEIWPMRRKTLSNQLINPEWQAGKPLFAFGSAKVLLLTENGNGDIRVVDTAGKSVVVANVSG